MIEFARPGFLWALPAVAIPLVIHLLNRRRFRPMPWAAMQFLQQAQRESRRRIRWQHLLLLALRTAAVLLLVLVFAQPQGRALVGGLGSRSVVVLLDDSASMAQHKDGVSAWAAALAACGEIARDLSGTGAPLSVYAASQFEPVFTKSSVRQEDGDRLRDDLARLQTTDASLDLSTWFARLGRKAGQATEPAVFHILTDFRVRDWGGAEPLPEVSAGLNGLADFGFVRVIDVGAEPDANVGIESLSSVTRFVYAGDRNSFRVVLNNGTGARERGRVTVRLDGVDIEPLAVPEISEGESRELPLSVVIVQPGPHTLRVAHDARDGFPPDDVRWLAFTAVERVPVLIIEGRPGASRYLVPALQPDPDAQTGLWPEVRPAVAGLPQTLADYAAIFLCDVGDPVPWTERLRTYVAEGGRVIAFAGPNPDAGAWNASFMDSESGLLPAILGDAVELRLGATGIAALDLSHPALVPFRGWETMFRAVQVRGYRQVEPEGRTRVLARYDDASGAPAVLACPTGAGTVVLISTTADDEWSDWPRSEAGRLTYVSLMHWLVEGAFGSGRTAGNPLTMEAGDALGWRLDAARYRQRASLVPPVGSREETTELAATPQDDGLWFLSEPLNRAGIWALRLRPQGGGTEDIPLAVNLSPGESDLARAPSSLFDDPEWQGRVELVQFSGDAPGTGEARTRYWPTLAMVAGILLLAETCLASLFSSRSGGSRPAMGPSGTGRTH